MKGGEGGFEERRASGANDDENFELERRKAEIDPKIEYTRVGTEFVGKYREAEEEWLSGGWREGIGWSRLREVEKATNLLAEEMSEHERRGEPIEELDLELEQMAWLESRLRVLVELGRELTELKSVVMSNAQLRAIREQVINKPHCCIT